MRRLFVLLLMCFGGLQAQTTTITGTIVDTNGVAWANASVTPTFVKNPRITDTPIFNGVPLVTPQPTVTANASGVFSLVIPSSLAVTPVGGLWNFTICPKSSLACASVQTVTGGGTQDLSSIITPVLTTGVVPSLIPAVDSLAQVISPRIGASVFNNLTLSASYFNGTTWVPFSGGSTSLILTTLGTSGAATYIGNVLNIPIYSNGGGGGTVTGGDGISAVTTGSNTALSFKPLVATALQNNYFAQVANANSAGGGYYVARSTYGSDSGVGRSQGNQFGVTNNLWHLSFGDAVEFTAAAGGIHELHKGVFNGYSLGDTSMLRNYLNFFASTAKATSDEGITGFYLFTSPLGTYRGTVQSTTTGVGITDVDTSPNGGCGSVNASDNYCNGGGWLAMRTQAAVYSGHINAITQATVTAPGTMTVDFTVTPSAAIGYIAAGLPDVVNFGGTNGDTLTGVSLSNVTGTIPSAGWACATGAYGTYAESVYATVTSSNVVTLQYHRFPESTLPNNGSGTPIPVYISFGSRCLAGVTEAETARQNGRVEYQIVGAPDSSHLNYVSYVSGSRDAPVADNNSGFMFRPGTDSHAALNVFKAAYVISTNNPTAVAYNNTLASGAQPLNPHTTGWTGTATYNSAHLTLEPNDLTFNSGDQFEIAFEPSTHYTLTKMGCNSNMPSGGIQSTCHYTQVDGLMDIVYSIGINNLASVVDGIYTRPVDTLFLVSSPSYGAGGGVFNNLFKLATAPSQSLIDIQNCYPGDFTSNCTGAPHQYNIWLQEKSFAGAASISYRLDTGYLQIAAGSIGMFGAANLDIGSNVRGSLLCLQSGTGCQDGVTAVNNSANLINTFRVAGLTNTVDAAAYPGADTGIKINAADTALGANTGYIYVNASLSGTTVTTNPNISANHTLVLCTNLIWNTGTHPIMNSNSTILGCGSKAPQTINSTSYWAVNNSLNNTEIGNLYATWTTPLGADAGNYLMYCATCNGVYIHDTNTTSGGWAYVTSTTNTYSTTTMGTNTSSNIRLTNNTANGLTGPCMSNTDYTNQCVNSGTNGVNIYAAFIKFTNGMKDINNTCNNLNLCVLAWGGNNNETTDPQPGDWTSMNVATLKAINYYSENTHCNNTQACHVWSMVDHVYSTGTQSVTCSDVCEDPEGAQDFQIVNFDLAGAKNGELSSFPHGANGIYGPGKVNHTSAVSWFTDAPSMPKSYSLYIRNGYNLPTKMVNILVQGITFDCNRSDGLACYGVTWDSGYGIKFVNNTFNNTPVYSGYTTSGQIPGVAIISNRFVLNVPSAVSQQNSSAFYALDLSSHVIDVNLVRDNIFTLTNAQYGGTTAIFKSDYFNSNYDGEVTTLDAQGNHFQNWPIDFSLSEAGANSSSVTPVYKLKNNNLGTGSVQTAANGVTVDFWLEDILQTPASSSAPCVVGQVARDATYNYLCKTANTWIRSAAYTSF